MISRFKWIFVSFLLCAVLTISVAALDTSPPNQVAVHEASHAVAALAQGGWIEEVVIFQNGGGQCGCFHSGHREMGIIVLAGYAGQRVLLNTEDPYGGSIDFGIGENAFGGALFNLLPQTERLIAQNQQAILIIAEELKRTHRMSGARARQLFSQNVGWAGKLISQQSEREAEAQTNQTADPPDGQQLITQTSRNMYGVMAALIVAVAVLAGIATLNGY